MSKKHETPETLEFLRSVLELDAESGNLIWKSRAGDNRRDIEWNTKHAGKTAGYRTPLGYIHIRFNRLTLFGAHRIVFAFVYGYWPEGEVDHRDGDPSNNRPDNLRPASRTENVRNTSGHRDSKSGLKGVTYRPDRNKWRASIYKNGKQTFLGHFETPGLACEAYEAAAKIHHGEFARTN